MIGYDYDKHEILNTSPRNRILQHRTAVLGRDTQPIDLPLDGDNDSADSPSEKHVSFTPLRSSSCSVYSGGKGKCPEPSNPTDTSLSHDLSPEVRLGLGEESPEQAEDEDDTFNKIDFNPELNKEEESLFRSVLAKFRDVFRPGWGLLNDGSTMDIKLKPGATPKAQAPFRNGPEARRDLDRMLDEMEAKGRIRPSSSPWASPVFTVMQNGKRRLVIDFRQVNDCIERDMYPIPRQDDVLNVVSGARFTSSLDMVKSFYQFPLSEDSKQYTAFTSHRGLWELNVSMMGCKTTPSYVQRKVDSLLSRYCWQCCVAYLDDLIVWSPTAEQHAKDLTNILEIFQRSGLTLSASKARIGYFNTQVLGHKVGRLGLGTVEEKIKAMQELQTPQNLKDLESMLGLFGYYRHFIPNFAQVANPLHIVKTAVTKGYQVIFKNQKVVNTNGKPCIAYEKAARKKIEWNEACDAAVKSLKDALSKAPVLAPPQWDQPFVLYCDASYDGFGVALHQLPAGVEPKRQNERPILYMSRTLSKHEANYAPTELEAACVIWAIHKLPHYLDGATMDIITDHRALQWLLQVKDAPSGKHNNRLLRWSLLISQYADKINVVHRPGRDHANADGLSRLVTLIAETNPTPLPLDSPEVQSILLSNDHDWDALYKADPNLRLIYERLTHESATLDEQVSYHAFTLDPATHKLYCTFQGLQRLCLPIDIAREHIAFAHENFAHLSSEKVFDRLSRSYWHPKLYSECLRFCTDCASCREASIQRHKPWGLAQPVLSPPIPFHTISMDFVTGLPNSGTASEQFNAFLTVTCKATKVVRIIPCTTKDTAETTARRFFQVVYRYHGLPAVIVSDRDTRFTSAFWAELCQLCGIERAMSTAYNPQADGQAEKTNQTVEVALRHYVDYTQQSWAQYIPQVEFAINSAKNSTTGMSPYRALYGVDVRDALEHLAGIPEVRHPTTKSFSDEIQRVRTQMAGAIAFAQSRQAHYYDAKHQLREFKVGDSVMLDTKNVNIPGVANNKLGPRRIGPFKILERHGRLAYKLLLPDGYKIHPVFSVAKLEPATQTEFQHSRPPPVIEPVQFEPEELRPQEEIQETPTSSKTRICANCGTTSSSAWRKGPEDTSLCNSCGLRYQRSLKRLARTRDSSEGGGNAT